MKQYRLLNEGEIIQKGDQYWHDSPNIQGWVNATVVLGQTITPFNVPFRRPMKRRKHKTSRDPRKSQKRHP